MIYKYKFISFSIVCLLALAFVIWRISKPSTIKIANEKLAQTKSYGEVKWVWQEYENDLADDHEWRSIIDQKLARIDLTEQQKVDLRKWYVPDTENEPGFVSNIVNNPKKQRRDSVNTNQSGDYSGSLDDINTGLSTDELARLYLQQGDEKCEAFKAANAPHLYHIANEYYRYAATLTNTEPSVCE
jgi:hypothetical protein